MDANVEQNQKALSKKLDITEKALDGLEGVQGLQEEKVDGLPEGWCEIKISQVAEVVAGGTPTAGDSNNFAESGTSIAWLTPADLSKYKSSYISYGKRDLSQVGYDSSSAKLLPKGSLLFSSRAPIGYVVIASNEISTNQGFKNFVFEGDINSLYAYYYLNSIRSLAESLGTGTTFKEISGATAKTLPFILPPLAEQTIIAQTLDGLLTQVDNIKTRLDTIPKILKTFRQSVLAAAVSGKLTEEWRGENECGGWKEVKLGDVGKGFNYGTSSKSEKEGDVPVLRMGNLQSGKLDWEKLVYTSNKDEVDKYILEKGDVLFNRTNSPELVGKTSIYRGEMKSIYAGYLIRVKGSDLLNAEFLNILLNSPDARSYCRAVKTDGVSQSNINAQKLRAFKFELPEMREQTQVVSRVEELFAFADKIEQQVKNAQGRVNNLTQSILAKAFRGELTTQWRADNPDLISGENSAAALLAAIKKEREELKPVKKSSAKKTIKKTVKKKAAASEKKAPSEPLSQDSIASESQVEPVTAKKPKAVVDLSSTTARQNKPQKANKDSAKNSQTAPSIESPETDLQWWAFIRSHYKRSNPNLTLDELMAHLVQTLQIKRLSPQRKALLEQVIKKACKWQVLYKESNVYCLYEVQFADYDNEALDILLPKRLRKGSSIPQDDLYREYLQSLGFKRGSPKAEERFKNYLRSALRRKLLQREGDELRRF